MLADDQPGVIQTEFIYENAPFPECHASTLAETKNGLVAAWFGGQYEKHPDVGIWVSRHVQGKWTFPVEVANGIQYKNVDGSVHRHPCWNPVLFQSKQGPLMLFYKVGPDPRNWWGMLMTSTDSGETWSLPCRLPENILGPVKNKPVQLPNGDILCGTSTEDREKGWMVHFERTSDLGVTWTRIGPVNDGITIGAIQPSILFAGGNRLVAMGRSRQSKVFHVESEDLGQTWKPMTLSNLPNPNSGTDAVTLADGRHLIIYNHTPKGRTPLHVALSKDTINWETAAILETEPGEYSYPAVIQTSDGLVHFSYTWKRQRVKHVIADPTKFVTKPIGNP